MNAPLAITGVTGAIGARVAALLAEAGITNRLLARDPSRAPGPAIYCEYGDAESVRAALAGADTVFFVSGAEAQDRLSQHRTFVEAAADAGVRHIVYTSFYGAAPNCTFTLGRDHYATEQFIRDSGMDFTFLRDNFYLDFLPLLAGEDGVIRGPAGDGRVAAVAREDIARVAADVLAAPPAHAGATYNLTGPEALTMAEVAAIISERGRQVTYHAETVPEAYESRSTWNPPAWQADAWVSTYTAIANGELAGVTGDVEAVTGRQPLGLRDVLA